MAPIVVPDKVEIPKNQPLPAQVASPISALSSHSEPWPHYVASALCAGAAAVLNMRNHPRSALAAAGFSLLYFSAGRAVTSGSPILGYDLSSATSLGLLAWTAGPGTGIAGTSAMLGTVGGVSAVPSIIKSYQQRTGNIKEPIEK